MKRLLFIAHRIPYPPDKGDRVRAFHEIRALREQFEVTLACPIRSGAECQAVELLRGEVDDLLVEPLGSKQGLLSGLTSLVRGRSVTEGYFHCPALYRAIRSRAEDKPFDVVLGYCSSMLPYVLATPATGRAIDLVDVDSAKWAGYAQKARWPKSWLYRTEARRVAGLERRAVKSCDAVLLVSEDEARALDTAGQNVLGLPNGVDGDYFHPTARPAGGPPSIVFTGTMDYRPNIEGVCWFADEVLPALQQAVGNLTFTIVGRDPTPPVQRLGRRKGITVTGSVPDVRPYFSAALAAVVPLHLARGIQNKVLEAMSAGRAVVGSPAALEGIEAEIGTDVLQAQSPDEWVEQILLLLRDAARREAIEQAARRRVAEHYTWPARMAPLVALCRRLAGDD